MNENLLSIIQKYLGGSTLGSLASFLGENEQTTTSAVTSAIPSILAGFINKASTTSGAGQLFDLIKNGNFNGSMLDSLSGILGSSDKMNANISSGTGLLDTILGGNKLGGLVDLLSGGSSMSSGSTKSLLGFLTPVIMSVLGKQVIGNNLNASGLAKLLIGQSSFIKNLLPAGLGNVLGFSSFDNLISSANSNFASAWGSAQNAGKQVGQAANQTAKAGSSMFGKLLPLLLLLLLGFLAFYFWRGCGDDIKEAGNKTIETTTNAVENTTSAVTNAVSEGANAAANAATSAWAALGEFFKKTLPNGVELNIPEKGIENNLITFIEDKSKPADKTSWFNFDRILFETGKNTLTPESQEQVKNIAEILKAYPNVNIKLGGYTDNTGDPKVNMVLSQTRAETVMRNLVALGIDAKRLAAEGYGDQHPVASNDTEEGRAQNRRIAILVTKK
ncbi:MAG: OmpA family protein [Chitinophagales bacterium]|nr:OmpA family protein [Bacteroidota bacterium]